MFARTRFSMRRFSVRGVLWQELRRQILSLDCAMTITYTGQVANAGLFNFPRLLFSWKGSIYKLVYKEMLVFCFLYTIISLIYRLALQPHQKRSFERFALYCETFSNLIPLSFVLSFYVALIVGRWWSQYCAIPWPDRVMSYLSSMMDGPDERGRVMRRTVMRHLTLGSLMVYQNVCVSVKKRFPTMEHLIEAGLATDTEVQLLEEIDTPHGKWWIPFIWACNIVKLARRECRISSDYLLKSLMDEIMNYRVNLGTLYSYDWVSVPLVYTQVCTLAVYVYFTGCLFGHQFLDPAQNIPNHTVDLYVPFFSILQFFFYVGWLKVAEQLINPFGEDDDDFDMNWIVDRNLQVSLLATDDFYEWYPPLEKDIYFGQHPPDYLPYTECSLTTIRKPFAGSTANLCVTGSGTKFVNPLNVISKDISSNHHSPRLNSLFRNSISSAYRVQSNFQSLSNSRSTFDGFKAVPQEQSEQKRNLRNIRSSYCARQSSGSVDNWLHDQKTRRETFPFNAINKPRFASCPLPDDLLFETKALSANPEEETEEQLAAEEDEKNMQKTVTEEECKVEQIEDVIVEEVAEECNTEGKQIPEIIISCHSSGELNIVANEDRSLDDESEEDGSHSTEPLLADEVTSEDELIHISE